MFRVMPGKKGGLNIQQTDVDGCPQDNSSTQQIGFGLRGVKTDGNIESCARGV